MSKKYSDYNYKSIHTVVNEDFYNRIKEWLKKNNVSCSDLIRTAVNKYISQNE